MTVPSRTDRAHRARSFDAAAAQYAANRPSYPPALLDAIEELAGRPLTGARVIDVGAGTGIATALLHARGADVLAVEPGDGMAAQFRRTHPDIPIVRGNGNALPVATACADFITYAQAWHWTDPAHSAPEALRVLRPGGALALWWNTTPLDIPWHMAQARRIERRFGAHPVVEQNGSGARAAQAAAPAGRLAFAGRKVRWSRRVPIDTHLANIGSHSLFLVHGKEASTAFLTEERQLLLTAFPDGIVEETYDVDLLVATTS
ncbi:class I SAM-dependent methyltransferase [Streptomyces sp. M41]|uniref:class I SAM-dependent methyltransferase n=1 Tax=Streptomyces sp. M41 TaxID=3059412 RepID=UPI00374DE801